MITLEKGVDKENFKMAVEMCIEKRWGLSGAFEYCKDLPFFQEVMDRLGVKIVSN